MSATTIGREEKFDPTLYNDDLAPIPEERRNWNWVNYSTVWVRGYILVRGADLPREPRRGAHLRGSHTGVEFA